MPTDHPEPTRAHPGVQKEFDRESRLDATVEDAESTAKKARRLARLEHEEGEE